MITDSVEDLLVTIYRLTRETPYARTKDIAGCLDVSLPTVSEKIVRLAREGYLDHQWRHGVLLTAAGRRVALQVLRKHRLIETFLVKVLHFSIDEVNDEACRLEHAVSDRFMDAIDNMLGHPEIDPHGHPIPSDTGAIAVFEYQPLTDVPAGTIVSVQQVNDRNREQLHYLQELGIIPGAEMTVTSIAPFDGPISLTINKAHVTLSPGVARSVRVACAPDGRPAADREHGRRRTASGEKK